MASSEQFLTFRFVAVFPFLFRHFRYHLLRSGQGLPARHPRRWHGQLRLSEHSHALRTDDRVSVEIEEFRAAAVATALHTKLGFCHIILGILLQTAWVGAYPSANPASSPGALDTKASIWSRTRLRFPAQEERGAHPAAQLLRRLGGWRGVGLRRHHGGRRSLLL